MQKTESKVIDGLTFQVTQLPPRRATKAANRLRRVLAPALAATIRGGMPEKLSDMKAERLADALTAIELSDEDLDYFTDNLLSQAFVTTPDGKTAQLLPVFDAVVTGVAMHMKLMIFAAEVNFGDFSHVFRGLAQPPAKAQSPSPTRE